ncbi:unnamed protein product [Brugia timori]|uniref:Uncharacterized protein n=1 Tax=Brugia timori TaxID=42155 RepID=A0A0R3R104_9BILA|nr:unnamed protein product [Brugia timori]
MVYTKTITIRRITPINYYSNILTIPSISKCSKTNGIQVMRVARSQISIDNKLRISIKGKCIINTIIVLWSNADTINHCLYRKLGRFDAIQEFFQQLKETFFFSIKEVAKTEIIYCY